VERNLLGRHRQTFLRTRVASKPRLTIRSDPKNGDPSCRRDENEAKAGAYERKQRAKSSGAKTSKGILSRALAQTTHGIKAWTPVLPTEREEDWEELRDGINEDWRPVGRTEQELNCCLSMAFWQRRRLYRHEKELILHNAKEEATPYPWSHHDLDEEQGLADSSVWNGGQAALRKEIAVCQSVLSLLGMIAHEPDTTPLAGEDALLLVERVLRCALKKDDPLPCLSEPAGGWTVTHHLEHAALPAGYQNHDAARLWDYDRRHLNTAIRCIHELQRLQAIRRGQAVAPPAVLDVTVTHQVDVDP
jgi:hypothetical protein